MDLGLAGAAAEEETMLAGFLGARGTLDGGDGVIDRGEHGFARTERIHGATLDEAFEDALVEEAGLDALAEIVERFEFAAIEARFANGFGGVLADVFDGGHAEADGIADGSEEEIALVDVGRKDGNAHAAGLVDVFDLLFGVTGFGSEQGGHELDRIVRLEPGGLVGEKSVGAGVRLVEAVAGEFFHQVEDTDGFFVGNFILVAAGEELGALRGHFFLFLFAHGAAQDIGFAEGKAGEAIGDLASPVPDRE